ncbi:hypothetical protein, partial [Bacillus cereus]
AGFNQPENKAGLTPKKQLNKIAIKAHALMTVQYDTFKNYVLPALQELTPEKFAHQNTLL